MGSIHIKSSRVLMLLRVEVEMWYPKIILWLKGLRRSRAISLMRYAYEAKCLWVYIRLLVVTDQTMMWLLDVPHWNVSEVVMWIECSATYLESCWIWLLVSSHAWGRVNLSSIVGLELLGAVIARQWWQEEWRLETLDAFMIPSLRIRNKLGQD